MKLNAKTMAQTCDYSGELLKPVRTDLGEYMYRGIEFTLTSGWIKALIDTPKSTSCFPTLLVSSIETDRISGISIGTLPNCTSELKMTGV